jgi:hypothetical protein
MLRLMMMALLASLSHGQSFQVGLSFAQVSQAIVAEESGPKAQASAHRFTVAVSRQPSAVLRAVSGEHMPEATALYSVRVCNVSAEAATLDAGAIEAAIVREGIAIVPRPLSQRAVARTRTRARSMLARLGEVAVFAAPIVLGFAASGAVRLSDWQIAGVSGLGAGLRIVADSSAGERAAVTEGIAELGTWLSDMPAMLVEPDRCAPAVLTLGSFDPQRRALVIGMP